MKRIIAVAAVTVLLAAGSFAGGVWRAQKVDAAHESADAATVYICPMHPNYHSDHPDRCPICGMPLTAHGAGAATGGAATHALPHETTHMNSEQQQANELYVRPVQATIERGLNPSQYLVQLCLPFVSELNNRSSVCHSNASSGLVLPEGRCKAVHKKWPAWFLKRRLHTKSELGAVATSRRVN